MACLCAGLLVGVLSLAVSIVGAVFFHDWAISGPDLLLLRLGVVFAGAGLVGSMPFVPFMLSLADGEVRLRHAALWIVGAAFAGAILGERASPLVELNPYRVGIPGVLLGAGFGAAVAASSLAFARGAPSRTRSR